ncbi:MAG: MtrB/PioB family decaheme-associated outer membrane protein, partial [Gammaproteobacteria bacterium]
MNRQTLLLLGLLSCLGSSADSLLAQDAPELAGQSYELGVGYLANDAYRFGRYNGLQQQGPYLIGDIKVQEYVDESGKYWRARGTRLGLDSRYLRLEGGVQGSQEYFFEYDQLPNNMSDSANTPFLGAGGSTLRLPAGFDINTNLDSALQPFKIETERQRLGLGGSFFPKKNWQLDISASHESKDGIDRIGGAIAGNPPDSGHAGGPDGDHGSGGQGSGFISEVSAALLPEPIDYQTNLLDMILHYAKDKAQFDIAYHLSLFDNDKSSLAWQDPFAPADPGSQSLAPDNQFHQLALTGGYLLPYHSHLSGVLSVGHMTQDEDFQSYTVNPEIATAALPRNSLDGKVWLTTAQLKLVSNPVRRLRLSAEYRHDNRDNDTQVNSYDYVVADSFAGTPVENNPLSYKRNQFDLMTNFRISSATSLRGGYSYDGMSRDYGDSEDDDTDENTVFARLKMQPHARVALAVYAERGNRDGSNDLTPEDESPVLRAYYLADRERTMLGGTVDYMATDRLSVTATADYTRDDYPDTEIGLTESKEPRYTLDLSYQPRSNMTTYAYYTYEDIKTSQAGSETGAPSPDWEADFDDTVNTLGAGVTVTGIRKKWDVGADLVYT